MSLKQRDWPTMISSSNENADVFMLWEWFPTVQSVRENITTANKCSSQRNTTIEPLSTESLVNKCLCRCYGVKDDSLCPYSLCVFMWNSLFVLGGWICKWEALLWIRLHWTAWLTLSSEKRWKDLTERKENMVSNENNWNHISLYREGTMVTQSTSQQPVGGFFHRPE